MSENRKKPYEKPALESEEVIESATLACGKCSGTGPVGSSTAACKAVRKIS